MLLIFNARVGIINYLMVNAQIIHSKLTYFFWLPGGESLTDKPLPRGTPPILMRVLIELVNLVHYNLSKIRN